MIESKELPSASKLMQHEELRRFLRLAKPLAG
jgi:hypothetical protein